MTCANYTVGDYSVPYGSSPQSTTHQQLGFCIVNLKYSSVFFAGVDIGDNVHAGARSPVIVWPEVAVVVVDEHGWIMPGP